MEIALCQPEGTEFPAGGTDNKDMGPDKNRYDFLIVGAGIFGAAAARVLTDRGARVLVAEKRDHIGGNAYTENVDGICVHRYGAHIFHTDDERVWRFVNRFARFNGFVNEPLACWHDEMYPLPFNMNTFRELWGVDEPEEAERIIRSQAEAAGLMYWGDVCRSSCEADAVCSGLAAAAEGSSGLRMPSDLREQAISIAGTDIYEKLIKGYTEKQWGRACSDLPASIIRRVPVRFEYNNNYFNDRFQGIPEDGYTAMIAAMLEGCDVMTGTDALDPAARDKLSASAERIICTGQIDAYYDYRFGPLGYRGLRFETERIETGGGYFQPRAVVNYTDAETPWTRIIEHRHFTEDAADHKGAYAHGEADRPEHTVITREYPAGWRPGDEAFYPVNDEANTEKYERYLSLAEDDSKVLFGGRLGSYRYYDMDDAVCAAVELAEGLR